MCVDVTHQRLRIHLKILTKALDAETLTHVRIGAHSDRYLQHLSEA